MRAGLDADALAQECLAAGAAQKVGEFRDLIALVAEAEPSRVLEIGTMHGGTLLAWCRCAADKATIVSLDLPNGRWGGGYTEDRIPRLEGYAKRGQSLHLLRGDSHDIDMRQRASALATPLDFLFIDGDHTYEGVKRDFTDYSPLVKPGGLIAFHDILHHPQVPECDVDRFWAEIRDDYETWEFTVDGEERTWGPWGGIGVIRW